MLKRFKDNKTNEVIQNAVDNYNNARVKLIDSANDLEIAKIEVLREEQHLKLVEAIVGLCEAKNAD